MAHHKLIGVQRILMFAQFFNLFFLLLFLTIRMTFDSYSCLCDRQICMPQFPCL